MNNKNNISPSRLRAYWPRARLLSFLLLAAWFLATFLTVIFARELADIEIFGWPVSFYMAAQGLALLYLGLIGLYVLHIQPDQAQVRKEAKDGN